MGRLKIPMATVVSPSQWYGFPPAVCPIASDPSMPDCFGYLKHWFTPRQASFVLFDVESRRAREIGRTADQFYCHLVMSSICTHDGVTPEIKYFASEVEIGNVSEIDDLASKTGDDPLGYKVLPQFANDLPLESVGSETRYTGSFPTPNFLTTNEWWKFAADFEVSDEVMESWPSEIIKPNWFRDGNRVQDFENHLKTNDLQAAWLTLNSSGWTLEELKFCIAKLASVANQPLFTLLTKAWTLAADERGGIQHFSTSHA